MLWQRKPLIFKANRKKAQYFTQTFQGNIIDDKMIPILFDRTQSIFCSSTYQVPPDLFIEKCH